MPSKLLRFKSDYYYGSHGGKSDTVGALALYYALAQLTPNRVAVVIGSGTGLVPRVLRRSQVDFKKTDSRVILIDANEEAFPEGGVPSWVGTKMEGIEQFIARSDEAIAHFGDQTIDYLHIDGDHRFETVMSDVELYLPKVCQEGIITLHDTANPNPYCGVDLALQIIRTWDSVDVLDLPTVGVGTAVLRVR